MEYRAYTRLAFCSNEAMVVLHDLFTDGQTDACTLILCSAMQPLKHFENTGTVLLFKTYTSIGKNEVVIYCSRNGSGERQLAPIQVFSPELDMR